MRQLLYDSHDGMRRATINCEPQNANMITTEERPRTATPMGKATRMEPQSGGRNKLIANVTLGCALMWDGRIPIRVKLVALALAVGITACVLAFEIPIEAFFVAVLSKPGFIGVMAFDAVEALTGLMVVPCLLLPSLVSTNEMTAAGV
jgi:hypothetical protein